MARTNRRRGICKVEGCLELTHAKGYCSTHYRYFKRHGKIERTRFTPNKIILAGDIATITLYNKRSEEIAEAIINVEDVIKASKHKWGLVEGYAHNDKAGFLHHFIGGFPQKGYETDHINRTPLDNRRDNLRFVTRSQSNANSYQGRRNKKPTTSIYKGVYKDGPRDKWYADITKDKKRVRLGGFDLETEAAMAYDNEAKRLFGAYALTNKMLGFL